MTELSASPEMLTDAGKEWLARDRVASSLFYIADRRDGEFAIRKRGADAAFRYLCTRHRRKPQKIRESKPHRHGIGWYLAWPFAALCGWIPLVPEAPHENETV